MVWPIHRADRQSNKEHTHSIGIRSALLLDGKLGKPGTVCGCARRTGICGGFNPVWVRSAAGYENGNGRGLADGMNGE